MIRNELMHNTPEQVREYLAQAAAIVTELELDGDLRVPAFVKAADMLASKTMNFEQVGAMAPALLGSPRI